MITDKQLILSNAQALTTTADSTNVIDFTKAGDAEPRNLNCYVVVSTALAGGTSVQVTLKTSADDSTYVTLADSGAISTTPVGTVLLNTPIPRTVLRYLKIVYTISGTYTSGSVDAVLVLNTQTQFNQ